MFSPWRWKELKLNSAIYEYGEILFQMSQPIKMSQPITIQCLL